ncbi:MAG: 5-formyltetrahydrofolate cyclo-ligase [Phocaeicola sp.]
MKEKKRALRKQIAEEKKRISLQARMEKSELLFQKLEQHPAFNGAKTILLYHSLPDEVATHKFIKKWSKEKLILLPVVNGETLTLKRFTNQKELIKSEQFNISEPIGEPFTYYEEIDLAIIPGVAFDLQGNRLGRGKGYYDRLLNRLTCPTIGVCFNFQVVNQLPTEEFDRAMNEVWTESGRTV